MSVVPFTRRSRGRFLPLVARSLALAVLLSQGAAVTGSAGAGPRATQIRVASCAGLNFHPIDSETGFGYNGPGLYRTDLSGSGYFLCDPDLPHRAVVTKIQFSMYDHHENGEIRYCALYRHGLQSTNYAIIEILGQVPASGAAATPFFVRPSDSTIQHATIDNAKYAYALQCQLTVSNGVLLYGANVTYSITDANG